jgi:hypothetical protein
MIIPCIDLMDGKVVQLVQGREKALEGEAPLVMLQRFAAFPEIQVIDLDAAMGRGANDRIVAELASQAAIRAGRWSSQSGACRPFGGTRRSKGNCRHIGLRCHRGQPSPPH